MKSRQIDMTTGSVFSKLMQFSIPLMLSSVLQLLFNAVDIVVVGHYAGDNALAAVGSTSSLINLLVNLFTGLSVGSNVVAANYFGSGQKEKINNTVHTAIALSLKSGIVVTVLGVFCTPQILKLMKSPDSVFEMASVYLRIYFSGIIFSAVYNFGSALLRSKGDTQRPLYILLVAGIINLLLNLVFVILFGMGVSGVAVATVISQAFSAAVIILILCREEESYKFSLKKFRIHNAILKRIIGIGVPASVQGIIFSFSNVVIWSAINSFGAVVVAGNSAASSLEGFVWISMNAFAQGTLTFTSQNAGAANYERIKKLVFVALGTEIVVGEVLGFLVYLTSPWLLKIYSPNPHVIQSGVVRLSVICTTYALCGIMDCMANLIRGIGYSFIPMVVTLVGACGFRLAWIAAGFATVRFHNCYFVYFSYPFSWALTFLALLVIFCFIFNKVKSENKS